MTDKTNTFAIRAINCNCTWKNGIAKISKNLDTCSKIIWLDQNNYVGHSSKINNGANNFSILAA